jgi:hypothetical protein
VARRARLLSPTAALRRNALYKGLLGGQRAWMAVGALVWAPRLMKKALGRTEQVVLTEKLEVGQALRIEAIKRPSRGERRAARRAR